MKLSQEQLLERLKAGEDLGAIVASLASPAEQTLLARARVARRFDERLYETVLREGLEEAPPFARFARRAEVEALRRPPGWYRAPFTPSPSETWPAPLTDAEALRLHRTFAAHFEALGSQGALDHLYHLIPVDEAAAYDRAAALFDEADRRHDLARCQDVLDVLKQHHLPLRLEELLADRALYLSARTYWEEAYYKTSRYFERDDLHAQFEAFLVDPDRWILQLYGTGGLGKTMFIRWLLARRCVPAPHRIPCARVDFDFVDPELATQQPWLFLVVLAEQLNRQLPMAPFLSLLDEVQDAGLVHIPEPWRKEPIRLAEANASYAEKLADEIPHRFRSELESALSFLETSRVVLIFDTTEEALNRYRTDLLALVETVAGVRSPEADLRLILSGRYDVREEERVPGMAERYGAAMQTHELKRLTPPEARRYLLEVRRVPEAAPIEAVVRRAGGMPFKLALFADLLRQDPDLRAEQIEGHEEADELYVISRIDTRIDDKAVRWLLRYGVVPRRLTYRFLEDVVDPYLRGAMAGESALDEAGEAFPTDLLPTPETPVDYRALWEHLTRYAGGYSWVSFDSSDADTLVFHGDVIQPLRRMLRRQPVYRHLHEEALRHYQARLEEDPARWVRWAREATYHAFQLEGPAAAARWRAWVQRASQEGDDEGCFALAAEVVGPDYVDEAGQPLPQHAGSEQPLIEPGLLVDAYYLMAWHYIRQAQTSGDAEVWRKAREVVEQAAVLQRAGAPSELPASARARIQAMLLIREGASGDELEAALATLGEAHAEAGPAERGLLRATQGDVLMAAKRYAEAAEAYAGALDEAVDLGGRERAELQLKLAMACRFAGRVRAGIEHSQRVLDEADDAETDLVARLTTCASWIEIGAPSKAFNLARKGLGQRTYGPLGAAQLRLKLAEASLARQDPVRAAHEIDEVEQSLNRVARGSEAEAGEARVVLLRRRAQARQALMRYNEALWDLEACRSLAASHNIAAVREALKTEAGLFLFDVGDLRQAGEALSKAERQSLTLEEERPLPLLRAAWHDARGEGEEARQSVDTLLDELAPEADPFQRARVALEGLLRCHNPTPERYLPVLFDALGALDAPTARLHALADLDRYPSGALEGAPALREAAARFETLIEEALAAAEDLDAWDVWRLRRTAAEVFRVIGDPGQARVLLGEASAGLRRYDEHALFAWILIIETALRLEHPELETLRRLVRRARDHAAGDAALARVVGRVDLLLAESALAVDDLEGAQQALDTSVDLAEDLELWNQLVARMHTLRAQLAGALGDRPAEAVHWREAADVWGRLAQPAAADAAAQAAEALERTSKGFETGAEPPADVADVMGPARRCVTLRWSERGAALLMATVDVRPAASRAATTRTITSKATLESGFVPSLQRGQRTADLFNYDLLRACFDDWPHVARELGALLPDAVDAPLGLCIEPGWTTLAAVPWEMAGADDGRPRHASLYRFDDLDRQAQARARWAQAALNAVAEAGLHADGHYGPATGAALRAFQEREGLAAHGLLDAPTFRHLQEQYAHLRGEQGPPHVLIVQPPRSEAFEGGETLSLQRGLGTRDLAGRYWEDGFSPEGVRSEYGKNLRGHLMDRPAIIHLLATMQESRSDGSVVLDFAEPELFRMKRGGEAIERSQVTKSYLSKVLHDARRDAPPGSQPPLLILDVLPQPGPTEALRQLFLRNIFAAGLAELVDGLDVLAVGPLGASARSAFEQTLVEGLAQGVALGELARRLRTEARPSELAPERPAPPGPFEVLFTPASTALFTLMPERRVSAPGHER